MCFRAGKMDQTQLCAWIGSVTSTPNPSNNVKISQSIIEIRLIATPPNPPIAVHLRCVTVDDLVV